MLELNGCDIEDTGVQHLLVTCIENQTLLTEENQTIFKQYWCQWHFVMVVSLTLWMHWQAT
jgi:hypothetical protein